MGFVGFTRHLQRNGAWFPRIGLSGGGPKYAPLVIAPQATAPTDVTAGSVYINSATNQLAVSNGTAFITGGGADIYIVRSVEAASVDASVFIADRAYKLISVEEVHSVAGSDGGAVTLDVKKCTTTQAPSAGTTMLAATINLKGTAETVQTPALSATPANLLLADGNRLALDYTGTLTALAGGTITICLRPV